jgi:transcription elongation factor GreA
MASDAPQLTREGYDRLKERLADLKVQRTQTVAEVAHARSFGDLKENAEYHAAREQQGLEEAEIRRLEDRLANAQIVNTDLARSTGQVFLGTTVKLRDEESGEEELYRLVGDASPNLDSDIIEVTVTSPMGEALFKATQGETIRVRTRRGLKAFVIVELL